MQAIRGPLLLVVVGVDWPHVFRDKYLGVHTWGRLEALENLH